MDSYDLIIIGTGAGGGTLLRALAPTGKRILVLERGEHLPREPANWDSRAVVAEGRYKTDETWLDATDGAMRPFHPGAHYCVGGNTKVYGAALFRFRAEDFGEVRHAEGVSPAWPIDYAELEPWYARAEALYEVRGARGEDPTEAWASGPYPHPAVPHEPRIADLDRSLRGAGLRPFHVPLGIRLRDGDRRSPCVRCQTCDGYPCLVDAKSDAQTCGVDPALEHRNVTLLTGAQVLRLETDAGGRTVRSVVVRREGREERHRGDVVVVSCGAVNSAALLLRSASDAHPRGLANGSGVVGRHYMCHNNSVLLAVSRTPNPTVFQKTIAVNDLYFGSAAGLADDWAFPLGHLSMVGKTDATILAEGAPPFVPSPVLDWMARHSLDFWLTSEDLPDPENRVTLGPDGGIALRWKPTNLEAHRRFTGAVKRLLRSLRLDGRPLLPSALLLAKQLPIEAVGHQCGTVRFGTDPRTSALDVNCRAHEVDNLYVVDTSFFVSSAAVNPALTAMANALRVAAHLAERLGADGALAGRRDVVALPIA